MVGFKGQGEDQDEGEGLHPNGGPERLQPPACRVLKQRVAL